MNIVISEYELEQIKYIRAMFFVLKRAVYFTGNPSEKMESEIKIILKHQLSFLSNEGRKTAINFLIKIEEYFKHERSDWRNVLKYEKRDWRNILGTLQLEYISIFENAITTIFLANALDGTNTCEEQKFRDEIWNPMKNKYYGNRTYFRV